MRIKMKTSMAGIDFACKAGDIIEIKDKWAQNLINSGQAELVKEGKPVERTTVPQKTEIPEAPKKRSKKKSEK